MNKQHIPFPHLLLIDCFQSEGSILKEVLQMLRLRADSVHKINIVKQEGLYFYKKTKNDRL